MPPTAPREAQHACSSGPQVNLKLFAPDANRKRTVLLFVIRDKTKTPLPKLVEVLEADLNRMWDSIAKPPQYQDTSLQEFFEVRRQPACAAMHAPDAPHAGR